MNRIIDYVVENGYMECTSLLTKPPFDKPSSFIKLLDMGDQHKIVDFVNLVKDNTVKVVG